MSAISLSEYKQRLEKSFEDGCLEVNTRDYGDFIPVKQWIESCHNGGFIDYDGNGVFAFKRGDGVWITGKMWVYPSDISRLNLSAPRWATHVLWFNR